MKMKELLSSDLKQAQKSRDSLKMDTLRLLLSEIQNKEIDLRQDIEDKDIISILTTQIKKRKEAAVLYEKNGRQELHDKEMQESGILESYLPEQVGEDELRKRIQEIVTEVGAEGKKDMGKVMKVVIPEFKGKADGTLIKNIVNELL
ncbi:MAG: GatB/YqeY domain-containing protein [Nitrospinales bacterium]